MTDEQMKKEIEYLQGQLSEALDRTDSGDEVMDAVGTEHEETREHIAEIKAELDEVKDALAEIMELLKAQNENAEKPEAWNCYKCGHTNEVRPNTFCDECGESNS